MFDAFAFLNDRENGYPMSENDIAELKPYNVNQALSQATGFIEAAERFNTIEFSKLPLDLQAMAYRNLNGRKIDVRWSRAKTTVIHAREEFIQKCITLYHMPRNDIMNALRYGLIDVERATEEYAIRYGDK